MKDKLTKKQEYGIAEWREHCLKIGRDTSPINKKVTEESWNKFYKILKKDKPKFWYCQSPLQAQIIINIFPEIVKAFKVVDKGENIGDNIRENIWVNIWENIRANIGANIRANIGANIRANIGENIRENIRANIRANIGANIRDNIGDNIGDNIWENIGDNIWENIGANIRDNIRANIRANIGENIGENIGANIGDNIRDNIWDNIWDNIGENIGANIRDNINNTKLENIETYSWCQHDINWIAYHKYFEKYGLLPYDENFKIFDIWYDLACSCGWCYTFKNIVFVCEKPNKLELNERGQLHKDGGMALEYSDGYGLHMLNGIAVPKYLAETSSELLDIEFFKKEQNADVKTEFVRKYGVDRLLTLGNKIDDWKNHNQEWWKKSEYELWDLGSLFNLDHAYHLRMKNLSVDGVFHVEAVSPQSDTLPKAIQYRLKGKNDTLTNIK